MEPKAGPGDDAVRQATGKGWEEWLAILDAAKAQQMNHKQIVAYLDHNHPEVSPWWQQSITVYYEQARGLRQKHEMAGGYQISRSKTIDVPLSVLYETLNQDAARQDWLPRKDLQVRTVTPEKSMRISWSDDSRVEISLISKGEGKSQITIQHSKLSDPAEAERMKGVWSDALKKLGEILEQQVRK